MVSSLIYMGALKVEKGCQNFRRELESYVWDQKAKERGDEKPVKQNDHAMDAVRYLVFTKTNRARLDRIARKLVDKESA